MFNRKSTIVAVVLLAFMCLAPVSVFAARNGTLVVIAQDTSNKQIAAPIYVDNVLRGTGKVTLTLPAKKHKVKFGDMGEYAIVSPKSGMKNVLVKAGKATTVKGTYQAATGTRTASGTYTWNSTKGVITWNCTSSNFVCEGPELGVDKQSGVTVTATTMIWSNDDMTWTRSSGTADDIVGTWAASDSLTGNSWTLTFNTNGTFSVVGIIVTCDGGGNNGMYTGSWSLTCPVCGDTAAGIWTATVSDGTFTAVFTITSGTHGIPDLTGTVSESGAITATAPSPPQCSSSEGTFIGQITDDNMTGSYSRPASLGGCEAEFGDMTATRQ